MSYGAFLLPMKYNVGMAEAENFLIRLCRCTSRHLYNGKRNGQWFSGWWDFCCTALLSLNMECWVLHLAAIIWLALQRLAVLEVIEKENLMDKAKQSGQYLMNKLKEIEGISGIRGGGLMIGFDVPEELKDLRKNLLFDHKIFTGEAKPNIIRLLPALTISRKQIEEFLEALKEEVEQYANAKMNSKR